MDREAELAVVRRAYARQVVAAAGMTDGAIEAAFAAVPRENFMGAGPWQMLRHGGYKATPGDDPVYLYTDDLVALDAERGLNNGQPSLHAFLLAAAAPRAGDHVVHVGTGSGYYTAVMAELVGPSGRVTGIEIDPHMAARARDNLSDRANVEILEGDGAAVAFAPADVIYVNAGATAPAAAWLDGLKDGGRLILPLTAHAESARAGPAGSCARGAVFRITRHGGEHDAKWIAPVAIFPCAGNRDPVSERALAAALAAGGARDVTRLYRHGDVAEEDCWLRGEGWCLAYR